MRLELVKLAAVDQPRDHFFHVIGRAHIFGHDGVEVIGVKLGRARVFERYVTRRACVFAQMRHDIAHDGERVLVILGQVIDHARLFGMQITAAKVFSTDFLTRCRFHQRRASQEDRALVSHNHCLVRHGRNISAASRAASHDAGNLRNALCAHIRLIEEDAPEMLLVGKHLGLMGEVRAAAIDQIDARQAVLLRNLLRAQVLLHRHRKVSAALHRRIVADDHALAA